MESARYEGFFSGHSLHRSGGTRLFQASIQRKLVKEVTGHTSDAIDKYQITSDSQRAAMSKILQGNPLDNQVESLDSSKVGGTTVDPINVSKEKEANVCVDESKSNDGQSSVSHLGIIIDDFLKSVNATGKAKITR